MPADPMDDVRAAGYRRIVRELSRAGYDWYEVSNFALPGRKARHNVAYWRARPYLGLGPGAVSTVGARRWTNAADPAAWAAALAAGDAPPRASEALDAQTRARERLLLAARCGERVPLAEVAAAVDLRARRRPRGRWIGFPAQWYNPRDAKGEARGRRGVRAPVSLSAFKGVDCRSRLGKSRSCGPSSRSTSRSGAPVGSKHLSERYDFGVAASTIRNDLADLEDMGMLAHPHTSAGRVPTDAGYRHYVDVVVTERRDAAPPAILLERDRAASEIDDALRETAEALSRVTELLAVVSAPAVSTSTCATSRSSRCSRGSSWWCSSRRPARSRSASSPFADPVDEGLAEFARVYLNERLVGSQLGTRRVAAVFESLDLRLKERAFLDALRPAFETPGPGDVRGSAPGRHVAPAGQPHPRRRRAPQRGAADARGAVQPARGDLRRAARRRHLPAHRPRDGAALAAGVLARRRPTTAWPTAASAR